MNADEDTLFEFPTAFPVKAVGRNVEGFRGLVVEIVAEHATYELLGEVREQVSKNGRFISITVTFEAQSKDQVDSIYLALNAHDQVMMVL